ncbi:MAG: hypothetical protein OZSIB_0699 [Candidatus Ozemobacter sibiricus]|uniref:Uncharacterized protein n=1 Tax=Candidatus Ozemobacter sibiricus TaxID=2268124 RepID=A0A367ZTU1_9BACT|nr:MAG: hypothetical protein OZSIB_0699 [Candidatus Ozemobacter sibiricus]
MAGPGSGLQIQFMEPMFGHGFIQSGEYFRIRHGGSPIGGGG